MRIERNADVITGMEDLELLYTFRNFPVFMGCSTTPASNDLMADMNFWISPSSGMIQLNPLLPLDVLYPEAHGAGCIGNLWAMHHQALAKFIEKFDPSSVLEIGGAHGILATNYQNIKSISWTILEPNPTPIDKCKAQIIKGFFDKDFKFLGDVDVIVHSHVLEHIYNPDLFVGYCSKFLKIGKKLIFSVPNMRVMLERKYTNCLNFEHTYYLSEDYIEILAAKYGFMVLEKKYFLDDHSIFYAMERCEAVNLIKPLTNLYEINKKLYLDYIELHVKLVVDINRQLAAAGGRDIFLFGAHVQAQYLIGFGLDIQKVNAILDNDSTKHGKRLFGTTKQVACPSVLRDKKNPIVIMRAGTFANEITAQIKEINPSVQLII